LVYPFANADKNRSSDRFRRRMNITFVASGTKIDVAYALDETLLNLRGGSFGILFFAHMRQNLAHA
jgi:hypothetical protein